MNQVPVQSKTQEPGRLDRLLRAVCLVLTLFLPVVSSAADSDGDNLTDADEVYVYGTNPNVADTDGDGMRDDYEVQNGLDPRADDRLLDVDGDFLDNWTEFQNGLSPTNAFTHAPTNDYRYLYPDGSRSKHFYDAENQLVGAAYSDGWGIGYEYDGNGNITKKKVFSSDEGNIPEILYGMANGLDDLTADKDGDGWTDWQEFLANTDPTDPESVPEAAGDARTTIASWNWPFVPSRLVLHACNLDGTPGDEIIVAADGDPAEHESAIQILSYQGGQWCRQGVPVGACGITSLTSGTLPPYGFSLYCGSRAVVDKGAILRLYGTNGGWVVDRIQTAASTAAYVFGVNETDSCLTAVYTATGGTSYALHELSPSGQAWATSCLSAVSSPDGVGLVASDLSEGSTYRNATIRLVESNRLEVIKSAHPYIDRDHLRLGLPLDGDVDDGSPHAHVVTRTGGVFDVDRNGSPGSALVLDGNDMLTISDADLLSFDIDSENFAISAWLRITPGSNGGTILFNEPAHDYEGYPYKLLVDPGLHLVLQSFDLSRINEVATAQPLTVGSWHHVCAVVDAKVVRLYVDGDQWAQGEFYFGSPNTGPVKVGEEFEGAIDELRVFNKPLLPVELDELGHRTFRHQMMDLPESTSVHTKADLAAAMLGRSEAVDPLPAISHTYRYVGAGPAPANYSWQSTHSTITAAIAASSAGDWIMVDRGTYPSITIDRAVHIKSLYGRDDTIIDAQNVGRAVVMQEWAWLEGLTVRNGRLALPNQSSDGALVGGAGICIVAGGVIKDCCVENCYVSQNNTSKASVTTQGGGIYAAGEILIVDSVIRSNTIAIVYSNVDRAGNAHGAGAYFQGGRVIDTTVSDNHIELAGNDVGGHGAGLSVSGPTSVERCLISGNVVSGSGRVAYGYGAGLRNVSRVMQCVIENNSVNLGSRSPYVCHFSGVGVADCGLVDNSIIRGNSAVCVGYSSTTKAVAAAYNSTLVNCAVIANSAVANIGTTVGGSYGCTIRNTVFALNSAQGGSSVGATMQSTVYYCIFHENAGQTYNHFDGTVYSCLIDDPEFVNLSSGNYHLTATSPCIDRGDISYVTSAADLDGNHRMFGHEVDIGPYEYGATPFPRNNNSLPDTLPSASVVVLTQSEPSGPAQPHVGALLEATSSGISWSVRAHESAERQVETPRTQWPALALDTGTESTPIVYSAQIDGSVGYLVPVNQGAEETFTNNCLALPLPGRIWDDLSTTSNSVGVAGLAGVARRDGSSDSCEVAIWTPLPSAAPSVPPTGQPTPPLAQVLQNGWAVGDVTDVPVRIWDAELNDCIVHLEYSSDGGAIWHEGALVGAGAGWNYPLCSETTGIVHSVHWDAESDLGPGYSGEIHVRTKAEDVFDEGEWCVTVSQLIDTSVDRGRPSIALAALPETVPYEDMSISVSGTANSNVVGSLRILNTRTTFATNWPVADPWLSPEVPLEPGTNRIVVIGTNAVGIRAAASVTIMRQRIDSTYPSVQVTNVLAGVDAETVILEGSASHYASGILTYMASTVPGVYTGAAEMAWSSPNVTVSTGDNPIDILATNTYGRSETTRFTWNANADTDSDGIPNGVELEYGLNPLESNMGLDLDGDGLSDVNEVLVHGSNPLVSDSDSDGLSDGDEVLIYGTNPVYADSDHDGDNDLAEVSQHGTDPLDRDSDDDGILDGRELIDGTSPTNGSDYVVSVIMTDAFTLSAAGGPVASATCHGLSSVGQGCPVGHNTSVNRLNSSGFLLAIEEGDNDGDGLPDDVDPDDDNDGLSDLDELLVHGSHPYRLDSDGDGQTDPEEVVAGTDPGDGLDVFRITDLRMLTGTNGVVVVWDSRTDRVYRIESQPALGGAWSNIHERLGTGSEQSFTNVPKSAPVQFYRLQVRQE